MHSEDGPVPVDVLADLQTGLLDDRTAAQVRQRIRTDSDTARRLAALNRARVATAALAGDADSAPDIPGEVTARIGAALRAESEASSGRVHRLRVTAAAAGVAAAVVAAAVGTTMLVQHGSAGAVPVVAAGAAAPSGFPLSDDEVTALVTRSHDLGALADPQRLDSCLGALGYPASTPVLGAAIVTVHDTPGVVMLFPGDTPDRIDAVVVAPNCSSVDTGLLARKTVDRR
jgi:hypothetical protein